MEYSKEFINLVSELENCTSLQELMEIGCRMLGNPMFYQDMEHNIVAYTKSVEVNHPDWERNIVKGILSMGVIDQSRVVGSIGKQYIKEKMPILTTSHDGSYSIIVQPIFIDRIPYGVLVVGGHFAPFKDGDVELVNLIATVLTSKVQYHKHFISPEKSLNETIIIKLLSGETLSEKFVSERIRKLKWKPKKYLYVMTIWGRSFDRLKIDRLDDIVKKLNAYSAHKLTIYNSSLVYIYSSDDGQIDWRKQDSELLQFLAGESLTIGISRPFTSMHQLREYYLQSLKAVSLGTNLKLDGSLCEYDKMSIYHLLEVCKGQGVLTDFCCSSVRRLAEYDKLHAADLSKTLTIYLECGQDVHRTAEILFIHGNTVRYRITRCRELMGTDLQDGDECFNILLSLKILQYCESS